MKLTKTTIALAALLTATASMNTMAADLPEDQYQVIFNGELVETTCELEGGEGTGGKQVIVEMGKVPVTSVKAVSQGAEISNYDKSFTIKATGCEANKTVVAAFIPTAQVEDVIGISTYKNFLGTGAGFSKGAQVAIYDAAGNNIKPGVIGDADGVEATADGAVLTYKAKWLRTGATDTDIAAGQYQGVADFVFAYK